MKNPLLKTDMFFTPKDRDELLNVIKQYTGNDQLLAVFICNITWNLAAKKVDEAIAEYDQTFENVRNPCVACGSAEFRFVDDKASCAHCGTYNGESL